MDGDSRPQHAGTYALGRLAVLIGFGRLALKMDLAGERQGGASPPKDPPSG
jgi:hypothetical protein